MSATSCSSAYDAADATESVGSAEMNYSVRCIRDLHGDTYSCPSLINNSSHRCWSICQSTFIKYASFIIPEYRRRCIQMVFKKLLTDSLFFATYFGISHPSPQEYRNTCFHPHRTPAPSAFMPAGFTRNLQAPHQPNPRAAICCKHGVLSWGFVGLDP